MRQHGNTRLVHTPVQQAGEVAVQALVAADELVGEGEAGHEAALLEPEDGAEGAAEEDALHGGEGDEALGEHAIAEVGKEDRAVGRRRQMWNSVRSIVSG